MPFTHPTSQQILDGLPAYGGRSDIIAQAARDLMKMQLPGVIALARTTKKGCGHLPDIADWKIAGEDINGPFPVLIVSLSTHMAEQGMGGNYRGETALTIGVLHKPSPDPKDILDAMTIAALCRGVMRPYRGGYCDDDYQYWNTLTPEGETVTPIEWKEGRGFGSTFVATQFPQGNYWPDAD